jgi:hypothetical protein
LAWGIPTEIIKIFQQMPIVLVMKYPRLNSLFFDSYTPSASWCQEIMKTTQRPFHSQMVPIYQWEEIVFVAIPWDLDPKNLSLEVEGHWQIVQADPIKVSDYWAKHFENISQLSPNNIESMAPPIKEKPLNEIKSEIAPPPPRPVPVPTLELPEGLDFKFQSTQALPEDLLQETPSQTPDLLEFDLPSPPTKKNDPELTFKNLDIEKNVELPNEILSFPKLPDENTVSTEDLDRNIIAENNYQLESQESLPLPPPVKDNRFQNNPPQVTPKNPVTKDPFVMMEAEKLPAPYIKKLSFRLERNSLKLLDSNGMATKVSIDLSAPSPFRVVYRTRNDYHGYVVPCPTLEKLFVEGINSNVPPYLTILPIIKDNKTEGMILAWANEDIQSLNHLNSLKASLNRGKSEVAA